MAKSDDVQVYNVSVVSTLEMSYLIDSMSSPVDGQLNQATVSAVIPFQSISSMNYPSCGSGLSGPLVGCSRDTVLNVTAGDEGRDVEINVDGDRCYVSDSLTVVADLLIKWDGSNGAASIDYDGLGGI